MGPGYFVIAILGCADGGSACTPVTTLQTQYATEEQCSAATPGALEANSNFDFPTLVARCRAAKAAASADAEKPRSKTRRG
jgi:acyl-CoA synthetase (AMP-forming)/AMP-acid ligase II